MEDLFTSHLAPVLVEGRPLDDLWLQNIICLWYELPRKSLYDRGRIDAVRKEVV